MLSLIVFLPLAAALALLALPRLGDTAARWAWVAVAAADLALVVAAWLRYDTPTAGRLAFEEQVEWIPGVNSSYHLGVDGLSLPLVAMTAVIFLACAIFALRETDRPRLQAALFLFLQSVSIGLFVAADLILFFVFFDLSIVGMYFVIAGWGHGNAARSAMKFFLYTFLGSLALLVGFIGLYIAADPHTFDMVELAEQTPFAGSSLAGGLVLAAILIGLAVKTPTVPFHTWLPPAHTDAPAIGSAVLAGVLLKMGTYGLIRIPFQMLREAFAAWSLPIALLALASILWGSIVAFAQTDMKRRIAYTSVNHMGYAVLGIAAAGALLTGSEGARSFALTGAVVEMVAHGLITGALFLIAGGVWARAETYEMDRFGGIAQVAPKMTVAATLAAFASLGLPGLAGFVAEVQIFVGAFAVFPWIAAVALLGILITAALFLRMLQQMFFGKLSEARAGFADLAPRETTVLAVLLALVVLIGLWPRWLLTLVDGATQTILGG